MAVTRTLEIAGRLVTVKVDEYDRSLHHISTPGYTCCDRNFPTVDGCWFSSFHNLYAAKYGTALPKTRTYRKRRLRPPRVQ